MTSVIEPEYKHFKRFIGSSTINANGTYNTSANYSDINEIMFVFKLGAALRQTFLYPKDILNTNAAFPDYTIGASDRFYFIVTFTETSLVVSGYSSTSTSASWDVYYR